MDKDIKVYPLKYPVALGQLACREVKLGRPKFKDFMAVGRQPVDTAAGAAALIASVSGLPEEVVRLFDVEDAAVMRIEAVRMMFAYLEGDAYEANPTAPPETGAAEGAAAPEEPETGNG
jgi:hypothetical protein